MALENPSASRKPEHPEDQDRSIKARKSSLFEVHDDGAPVTRPFAEYLKTVPAWPMSPVVKASLIGVGVIVVLLLLGALFSHRGARRPVSRGNGLILPLGAAQHA